MSMLVICVTIEHKPTAASPFKFTYRYHDDSTAPNYLDNRGGNITLPKQGAVTIQFRLATRTLTLNGITYNVGLPEKTSVLIAPGNGPFDAPAASGGTPTLPNHTVTFMARNTDTKSYKYTFRTVLIPQQGQHDPNPPKVEHDPRIKNGGDTTSFGISGIRLIGAGIAALVGYLAFRWLRD